MLCKFVIIILLQSAIFSVICKNRRTEVCSKQFFQNVPREVPRVNGALNGDREVPSPVRKQRLPKSKEQLVKEASEVLHRADRVSCVVQNSGNHPEKFFTLPARKKHKPEYSQASLDRANRRRNSDELTSPPRKPPRTFASTRTKSPQRTSIFSIFKKTDTPAPPPKKKSNLRRSVSDASALKAGNDATPTRKRPDSDAKEVLSTLKSSKKQLSPIIEVTQREDYFEPHNKENIDGNQNDSNKSITEQLQEYIDEVDADLFKETGIRISPPKDKGEPQPVIIDVDKADQISKKKSKSSLGNKLKALTKRATEKKKSKPKTKEVKPVTRSISVKTPQKPQKVLTRTKSLEDVKDQIIKDQIVIKEVPSVSPNIQKVIDSFEHKQKEGEDMIHSSQKPVEKLPLTRGRAVDNMVKRLSRESTSPPPQKTNIVITPSVSVQHNNNQPFSYTRGISPEKHDPKPIIYAQVVCNNKQTPGKHTVHTTYINGKKNIPHSDSDEGLGYEENPGFRKYDDKPATTQFGDRYKKSNDFFSDDRFDEEYPITPKFKNVSYNGFSSYESEQNGTTSYYIDSSSRGRGDGMDSKRRESLTEPENGLKYNTSNNMFDLSARRDLLESRINRRFAEKTYRQSPEYSPKPLLHNNVNNVYISENSRYYRSGSASPVCVKDKYTSETIIDKKGEKHTSESRSRKYFGEPERITYNDRYKDDYRYNSYNDNEPKSFDSQISDYRSSPENNRYYETSQNQRSPHQDKYQSKSKQQIIKDREIYKSNPEIHHRNYDGYKYDNERYQETYHDSLKREKHENHVNGKYRYFDQNDNERKDKFGDSGIENDFRRDSGDNFKLPNKQKREPSNESEDEGFASSLLIASERQHTEDNFARRRREYEMKINGRGSKERDDPFRNLESLDYKYKSKDRYEYSPRERSIDDGSHYDPRLDKEHDRGTLKKVEKKPPKPEKKSGLEKVKSLFTRDSKKKKEKERNMVPEDNLRSRYTEYRGSREQLEPKIKRKEVNEVNTSYNYNNRRRLSTPSPTREPPVRSNEKQSSSENTHSSWFKSLDRLSRKKSKKSDKDSSSDEMPIKSTPTKNLRFFGDTDIESNDSLRKKSSLKQRPSLTSGRVKSQSTRDLHNISEEIGTPPEMRRVNNHKSMLNISESDRELKGSRTNLKPPMSPSHRHREGSRGRDDRLRRRKNEVSSVESSTEGDSSQQSQRSVVYLHAATVGDIPGPGYLKNGRRAASREELTSNGSSRIQPQVKTLSRSFSVLAPWRPKHFKESMDIDYTQYPKPVKNGKYEQRTMKNGSSRKDTSSTLKKKAQETRRSNQNVSTLNRRSRSKENVSTLKRGKDEPPRGSNSTLYKKKEKQGRENNRYTSSKDDRKMSSKSMSVESLGGGSRTSRKSREEVREVSRSISMPRDPEKSAGWFKMNKKSKKTGSTQRL